jgi:CO/xanthine dehydrogenase Mo-binding subunit
MTLASSGLSRRRLLIAAGALVVTAPAVVPDLVSAQAESGPAARPPLKPSELDSWIAVAPDGRVTAFFGKPDVGQGVDLAIAQIVAEELDVSLDRVEVVCADTALTCDQGGVSGSTGVQRGGIALRNAAAEARRVLLDRASAKLGLPVEQLAVEDGVVFASADHARRVAFGELITGGYFHQSLEWNGQYGNNLVATGKAKPKSPKDYKVVGASPPRRDVAGKVYGEFEYVADLRRPGMLHGRVIRPPVAGAAPVRVDETSVASIPGVRILRKGGFLGVVADHEWDAIRAARLLKVVWSDAAPPFVPNGEVYDHIRAAPVAKREVGRTNGDVDKAWAGAARIVEAEYEWPFQSHSSLAPACAVADVRPEGVTIWQSSQKPHATSQGVAKMLGLPAEKVRSISVAGPGSYGRNDAGDAAADAVVLSMLAGKPVRVQGTRRDGHAWDPKGTASIHKARAALDAQGRLVAYEYTSKGFSRMEVATAENEPSAMLAGQLLGFDNPPVHTFGVPEEAYEIPNRRMAWETIQTLLAKASPLRTSHLRDPLGPQMHFASECFMDECALAANADPVAFRLSHMKDPRHRAAIQAAAEKAGWKPGPPGARRTAEGGAAVGRGFAYANRGDTVVAVVAEVVVDRKTGRIWPRRFVVAHDCGLIVNPQGLERVIEGNVVHATSRALFEEVKFDRANVTSGDWLSYPILDIQDAPEAIDIVLINRPETPPSGAGEPATRPIAAAIANAVFDATGLRLRRAPLVPELRKALARA